MVAEVIKVNESEKERGSSKLTLGETFWLENRVNRTVRDITEEPKAKGGHRMATSGTCPRGHQA